MFFSKLLKTFLVASGFLLVGFGIGMVISENFQIEKRLFWFIVVGTLIFGGFLTALGMAKRVPEDKKASQELTPSSFSSSESEEEENF